MGNFNFHLNELLSTVLECECWLTTVQCAPNLFLMFHLNHLHNRGLNLVAMTQYCSIIDVDDEDFIISISITVIIAAEERCMVFFNHILIKRREEKDTYLTHVCRHCWSKESMVKRLNIRSFQPTLWHSSAVVVASSGRCCTLPFFLTFLSSHLSRFSFYINI